MTKLAAAFCQVPCEFITNHSEITQDIILLLLNVYMAWHSRGTRHILESCEQHSPYHHVHILHAVRHGAAVPKVPLVEEAPHAAATGESKKQ